jgi:hypothetical protein
MRIISAALLAVLLLVVASGAQAGTIGVTFTGNGNNPFYSSGTFGYSFTVGASEITATHLGIYDTGQDGLLTSHDVGLWDNGGTLLASTTIASGTSAVLDDLFRFNALSTGVALSAGSTYYVGAEHFVTQPDTSVGT